MDKDLNFKIQTSDFLSGPVDFSGPDGPVATNSYQKDCLIRSPVLAITSKGVEDPYMMRSNASWVMVIWDPPEQNYRYL